MITDEKAMKYVRKLKKYCEEHWACQECLFNRKECPMYTPIVELDIPKSEDL